MEYLPIADRKFYQSIHTKKEFQMFHQHTDDSKKRIKTNQKDFSLFPHQAFLKHFINPDTPYTELLLYHGTGTGKTCTALSIVEQFKEQVKRHNTKILILSPSPKMRTIFAKGLFDHTKNPVYFQCARDAYEVDPGDSEATRIKRLNSAIDEYYYGFKTTADGTDPKTSFRTVAIEITKRIKKLKNKYKLSNPEMHTALFKYLQGKYSNTIIVIDEFHNYKEENQSASKAARHPNEITFRKALMYILYAANNTRLLLLSATPIGFDDTNKEVEDLTFIINMFRANSYQNQEIPKSEKDWESFGPYSPKKYRNYKFTPSLWPSLIKELGGRVSFVWDNFDIKVNNASEDLGEQKDQWLDDHKSWVKQRSNSMWGITVRLFNARKKDTVIRI